MFNATKLKIPAIALVLVLTACQTKNTNEEKINLELIQSFNESNVSLMRSTSMLLKTLEDLSLNPVKNERATPWFNKAVLIDKHSISFYRFIDSTINKITPEKEIEAIYAKTVIYKSAALQTDTEIAETFANHFNFINPFFNLCGRDTISNKPLKNHVISKQKIVLLLESLKNKVMNLENKLISFCFQKVPSYDNGYDAYSMIAGQNASIFAPGSIIELKAGIGAFSKAAKPIITFGGDTVLINEEGFAVYRRKVPATPGNYKTPVRVSFFNQITGKEEIKEFTIEYRVVKPCE